MKRNQAEGMLSLYDDSMPPPMYARCSGALTVPDPHIRREDVRGQLSKEDTKGEKPVDLVLYHQVTSLVFSCLLFPSQYNLLFL